MKPTYATLEQFMAASDTKTSANEAARIDRLLQSASRAIDESFHRHFYPETAAYTYAFTGGGTGFWMERDLLTLSAATVDGTAQTVSDVELYPQQYGPPYNWIGLMGSTVVVTGVWGFSQDTVPAGALAEALDATETEVDVTDSAKVGVGDLLTVDTERMLVTEKALLDTTTNLNDTLTAVNSDTLVTVDDGTAINVGEPITINSERMFVVSISGNDLTVERAADGSVLAAHSTGVDVFAPRRLTVERGATGSTAATHSDTTAITKNDPPSQIKTLCLAEAMVLFQQELAAFGRTVGSGESERESSGKGLADARRQAESLKRGRLAAV